MYQSLFIYQYYNTDIDGIIQYSIIKNLGNMILFISLSHQSMHLFDMYIVPKYILTKYFSHK